MERVVAFALSRKMTAQEVVKLLGPSIIAFDSGDEFLLPAFLRADSRRDLVGWLVNCRTGDETLWRDVTDRFKGSPTLCLVEAREDLHAAAEGFASKLGIYQQVSCETGRAHWTKST